ncbi:MULTISPECIES: adenylate/guanylate cyclase domain-containing protein [Bradyrhizobium]|uniref:Class 3 adenylate cyclase/predicted ATPase n=1 Tax=Bradyrhizobium ottawaense TaxID=931866 RepID=A0ABV4G1R9_9BRAD|nr:MULTISPECIES: adenylate/guanylate cyclase domain-containing protein [Bradyrhizobium]WLB43080.1 adenylate/guanylate cyclase domain-containing protein [Bradyrhizobium ottawaense]WQN80387.1 adenylate/guanylate cyclase domain-containing protein [Bradyrhizobium ottawaense]BBO06781.1 adenylate cyclase [Bradyrhizobium ottawaense]BBO12100.1 adenylate cyclase [Bradyrhizobium sp. TM102]GMO47839.1 adenylate/guanylate cyclase domain-containing protein [Bradyrhizobium ottawaense]
MLTENKQVSVLFVDVCNSTSLLQHVDPEEARAYLGRALDRLAEAVETYGGTVSQLLGDGLVALFGAPVAQEDHALRACLAALKMQRASIPAHDVGGVVSPTLRIGINSGEVLVGIVGQYRWSHYGADGKTIHLASRLEKMAPPGGILISAATQRLVAQQIDTRTAGVRIVRGLDDPIEVHEVVVETESSAAAPLTRKQRWAPLIGREDTLRILEGTLETVQRSGMRTIGLCGDAGIGKSRLIVDWMDSLAREGVEVCFSQARGYASTRAYSTATDLTASLVGLPQTSAADIRHSAKQTLIAKWPNDGAEHLAAVNDLLGLAAPDEAWLALNPAQRRRRIGEALLWLVRRRVRSGAFLLVLEDVFLADRESRRLFEGLLPKLQALPVLICVTYRPDFDHQWRRASWFSERVIEPLGDGEMLQLARACLGDDPSVLGVMTELVARADGNPFFLEQLVFTLIDDGSLEGTPGAYRLQRPFGELRVPGSIAAVIGARVDRLPEAAKSALEAAAILGDPITHDLVAAMQAVDLERAEELLGLCVASGLLTSPDQARGSHGSHAFAFRHALVRDVVLGVLTRARLKALHRQAFLALHAQPGAADVDAAPALAHHAFGGEEWEQAARFAVKSMARAISRSANQEAVQLLEKGIQAARRVEGATTAQTLELALRLEAIGAMLALGQIDEIFDNMERAEAIAVQLNDQRARAAVSTETAVFLWMRGRFEQGLGYASQGLEAARLAQRRHMMMAAHQTRLMHLHALGRYADAAAEGHILLSDYEPELSAHYVQSGWAAIPIINLYAFHASTLWRLGDGGAADDFCAKSYEILSNIDHPYSRLLIDTVQSQIWVEREELDRAESLMRTGVQQCMTHNVPTMLSVCTGVLGSALARNGKAAEAVPMLEKGFADRIYEAAGPYGRTFMRVSLGVAYRKLGRLDDAIAVGRKAVEQAAEEYGHQTEALYELAETLRQAGDQAGAEAHFKRTAEAAERLGMPHYRKRAAAALADRRKDGYAA